MVLFMARLFGTAVVVVVMLEEDAAAAPMMLPPDEIDDVVVVLLFFMLASVIGCIIMLLLVPPPPTIVDATAGLAATHDDAPVGRGAAAIRRRCVVSDGTSSVGRIRRLDGKPNQREIFILREDGSSSCDAFDAGSEDSKPVCTSPSGLSGLWPA